MTDPTLSAPEPHGLEVLRTYGEGFAGRQTELAALDQAWDQGVRVFILYAEGGAGKTRVVAKWLTRMRDDDYRGAGRVFVHSFYTQGSDEQRNASSDLFFEQALPYFGHTGPRLTDPTEQGRTLARLIREQRALLVLDGLEPLQHPPSVDQGRLKDPAIRSLLLALAAGRLGELLGLPSGLCVVTSRQLVVELQDKIGRTVLQQSLERLDAEAGAELLRQLGVRGPEQEIHQAVEDSRGHAYSLMLLGSYLRDATDDHEIRRRHEIPLLDQDKEYQYHARHLFGAYVEHLGETCPEVAVLRLLGFFDRPAEEKLVAVLREAAEPGLNALTTPLRDMSAADRRRILSRLKKLRLIDIPDSASSPIDSHPLLREYFAEQLQTRFPEAWQAGHQQLFEYLCNTTEHQPSTLAGLQPLYQAVAHGCLAGIYEEALVNIYHDRIMRGTEGKNGFYNVIKLGAISANLGALTCFFKTPWSIVSSKLSAKSQSWVLSETAFQLRVLGRVTESVDMMQSALASAVSQKEWKEATTRAFNLCELELTLGDISAAVATGMQSLLYSALCKEKDLRGLVSSRTTLADALHQAGNRKESEFLFLEAESWQTKYQPDNPQLCAVEGFYYCDLLLSDAERIAWRNYLFLPRAEVDSVCDRVHKRATRALDVSIKAGHLLPIGLYHLALARSALYKVNSAQPVLPAVLKQCNDAVLAICESGQIDDLPHGLLTRAWIRFLSGDEPGCREDLNEAWEIAERGPMPLFQADILLYRARLFRDRTALAEAHGLIEKHGYHRRDEELADAEEAAKSWPETPTNDAQVVEPYQISAEARPIEDAMRDQVFISYSHRDKKFMEELLTHLKPYVRSGITVWSDKQIASGSKWFDEIKAALTKTKIAVLLVSPDFLASDFIHEHELGPFLKEAQAGDVRILWVPLRASSYQETPLKDLQAVSAPDEPLGAQSKAERDEAWVGICKEIKKAVGP